MCSRIDTCQVLDALLMGLWWRQPKQVVTAHSNQGGLFTAHEWQAFPSNHNLGSSTSRRGNFHDNAVTESFFQSLKRERIRRQVYAARNDARADVFDYVKMFYNTRRQHGSTAARQHGTAGDTSLVDFERRGIQRFTSA
jgi:putative transposase